jgi:hypothetical protein
MALELDPRRRIRAEDLLNEPYVVGSEIRMTAFEMAS